MMPSHRMLKTSPSILILLTLLFSCGESPDERVSKGHRDAIKAQCKSKSDPKLCGLEVRKLFISDGHEYVMLHDLSKSQENLVKLNCVPKKKYGLVPYNDCLGRWKATCKRGKCTDPDNEREKVPKSNIDKLKEYSYYILSGDLEKPHASGTGVAIDKNYIVTNCHVVFDELTNKFFSTIWVMNLLDDKKKGRVKLYKEGHSKDIDICILKTRKDLKYVKKKVKYSKLKQTDYVRALGNPKQIMGHSADGNINAFETWSRDRKGNKLKTDLKIIIHDAAMGQGSSGGPLFDIAGNLIGINSMMFDKGTTGSFGLAISVDHIKDVLKN